MSVRNRGGYAGRHAARSAGMSAVRSVFVVMMLAMLSFALGFFVLARLMPDSRPLDSSEKESVASADAEKTKEPTSSVPASTTFTSVAKPSPAPLKATESKEADDGPTIEAESATAIQTPDSPDKRDANSAANDENTTSQRNSRKKRRSVEDGSTQPATSPDGVSGGSSVTAGDANAAPPTPKPRKRYHVQLGQFSTQEEAEAEVQRLALRGIETTIRTVERDGVVYYSVQHSEYRTRARAKAAQRKLRDDGVDSYVTER